MEISSLIVTYSGIWWVLFFIFLPIGASSEGNKPSNAASGFFSGKKLLIVSLLAFPISFFIIYIISTSSLDI